MCMFSNIYQEFSLHFLVISSDKQIVREVTLRGVWTHSSDFD